MSLIQEIKEQVLQGNQIAKAEAFCVSQKIQDRSLCVGRTFKGSTISKIKTGRRHKGA